MIETITLGADEEANDQDLPSTARLGAAGIDSGRTRSDRGTAGAKRASYQMQHRCFGDRRAARHATSAAGPVVEAWIFTGAGVSTGLPQRLLALARPKAEVRLASVYTGNQIQHCVCVRPSDAKKLA